MLKITINADDFQLDLTGYATRAAAKVLLANWNDCFAEGVNSPSLAHLGQDVEVVCTALRAWRDELVATATKIGT